MLPEFPGEAAALCTCSDFARRGLGGCKHIAAAQTWLSRHPPEPVGENPAAAARASGIWLEIDRRLARSGAGTDRPPRELARPGAALFEGPVRARPGRDPA
jgi:hypothetical protein